MDTYGANSWDIPRIRTNRYQHHSTVTVTNPDPDCFPSANYGTPEPATFADGPFTVKNGTGAELFGGTTSAPAADTVLLVLSATSADVASLGIISLKFDGLPAVSFAASDFFTTAQTGFPTKVMSIANGTVNGIGFLDALHAAADITFSGPLE